MARIKTKRTKAGFTLIEVTIAVLILASSLMILMGLQSATLERAARDDARTQALLIARRILAAIETQPQDIQEGQLSGSAEEILGKFNVQDENDPPLPRSVADFTAGFEVQDITLPSFKKKIMHRVLVRVAWSADQRDMVEVLYYAPIEKPSS
jgi:prepilin-type N-terminal cleavage/methylation domain-containing protein